MSETARNETVRAEERAAKIGGTVYPNGFPESAVPFITEAIREAEAAMKEQCIQAIQDELDYLDDLEPSSEVVEETVDGLTAIEKQAFQTALERLRALP